MIKICCCRYLCRVLHDILLSCAVWKGKKLTLPAWVSSRQRLANISSCRLWTIALVSVQTMSAVLIFCTLSHAVTLWLVRCKLVPCICMFCWCWAVPQCYRSTAVPVLYSTSTVEVTVLQQYCNTADTVVLQVKFNTTSWSIDLIAQEIKFNTTSWSIDLIAQEITVNHNEDCPYNEKQYNRHRKNHNDIHKSRS